MKTRGFSRLLPAGFLVVSVLLGSSQATAQDTKRAQATRAELQASLAELERYAASSGYSSRLREEKRREAGLIRGRLEEGDFQVGDHIFLEVRGEKEYSDTFPVSPGRVLSLPGLPDIPLQGVLRAEARDYFTAQLSRYFRDPQVRVRTMIRLSVFGSVGRPGFFQIPADVLATEAFMQAGGPSGDADPRRIFVRRGETEIWPQDAFQDAIRRGLTLDQMNLRAGDELVMDPRKRVGGVSVWAIAAGITGLASSVYFIRQIFR